MHGGKLETKQFMQGFIAESYIDIQAARLMTIHCAEKMDSGRRRAHRHLGDQDLRARRRTTASSTARSRCGARPASRATCRSPAMYQGARTLRLADGPDEVHKILIAKNVLKRYHARRRLGLRELTSGVRPTLASGAVQCAKSGLCQPGGARSSSGGSSRET